MRLTAIILLSACITASAKTGAQTITLNEKNATLETVLKQIQKQTGYQFLYTVDVIQKAKPVSIAVKNSTVEQVLRLCFKDQPLDYNIIDKLVVIKEKSPNENGISNVTQSGVEVRPPIDIHGRIVNEKGEPVAASIVVKGTNKGTTTNDNGEFELKGVDDNATLVITGVSIESFEVKVNGRSDLALNANTKTIVGQEVVVNKGYYNVRRRENTGNVSTVTSTEIQKQPISNPLQALEGRMAGVYISQTSGLSGSGMNIEIRGRNSLRINPTNNGNLPFFIIDGVPFTSNSLDAFTNTGSQILPFSSPLNTIDPLDIESIEVLKDADATAIYGSRGANGVVLITTKKGKPGKTKGMLDFYTGVGKVTRTLNLLNTSQYLDMRREGFIMDGSTPQSYDYDVNGSWDTTQYTDWQKVLFGGTAKILSAQGSVSGGNQNTQFLLGGGYYRQSTVFPGNFADNKISGHFNLNHISNDKRFTVNTSISYVAENNNLPGADPTFTAIYMPPNAPKLYNADGTLNWQSNTWTNPMSTFRKPYKGTTNNFVSNSLLSYRIFRDLVLKTSAGYTNIQLQQTNLTPIYSQNPANSPTGFGNFSDNSFNSWVVEPQLDYTKNIYKGKLTVNVGTTFQQSLSQAQGYFAKGFTNDALISNPMGAPTITSSAYNYAKYRYNAAYGRINYNLKDKYLINLTGRRDGSSRFGPGKQFANFGAVGAGWIFSSEDFFKGLSKFISFGKLRSSYGLTGNDQIPDYGYLDTYSSTRQPYNGTSGLIISRLFNPNYGWEENKKFELTLELGLLANRILLNTSFYQNRSSNQLVGYPLPTITGQSSLPFYNLPATVENKGWEFELTTTNIDSRAVRWTTNFNISIPKNKLISFPNLSTSTYATQYEVGKSIYVRRLYHYKGIDQQTGLYTFEDVTKNGSIDYPDDLMGMKSIERKFYGGLQNTITYKGLQLDFLFQFVKQTGFNYMSVFGIPGNYGNQPTIVLNRWQKPGDNATVMQYTIYNAADSYYNALSSDATISDASFIRLKNVYLSYQFPQRWLNKTKIQSLKIFGQGQNLFTITNYLGLDPESQSFYNIPPLRVLSTGLQINF